MSSSVCTATNLCTNPWFGNCLYFLYRHFHHAAAAQSQPSFLSPNPQKIIFQNENDFTKGWTVVGHMFVLIALKYLPLLCNCKCLSPASELLA